MRLVERFIINPCGPRGTCLVKPSCQMKNQGTFLRKDKCPDFKKYYNINDNIDKFIYWMSEFFGMIFILCIIIWIIVTFVLGLIDEWYYLKHFINFVRGT